MGMGSLTVACVLLLANAGAEPELIPVNSLRMKIPITLEFDKRNDLREIVLYSSADEGKTWSQAGLAKPDQGEFQFTAPGDGQYWFTIQTVDKNGIKSPADPYKAPVGQKIVVDTIKPLVKLKAERKGDEILASWEVTEEHPDRETFVLEYHLPDQPPTVWTPIPAMPGPVGTGTIKPAPTSAVSVQLRVKDTAKNEGSAVIEVPAVVEPPLPPPLNVRPPQPLAIQSNSGGPPPLTAGAPPLMPMRGALPPKTLVNRADVKLDFDVTNIGPSGFGTVEVHVTIDEGAHWTQLPPDPATIQPPEMRGLGQARGSVSVHLPEDRKVFGFYLIVRSRAGMGKERPLPGTAPQIRLERDLEAPVAKLIAADPDPTRHDTLILKWSATDPNLTDRPITLQWAPKPDGPWEFIGGPDLPNTTSSYAWQVPPTAAAATSVYLKLTVRDGAGNEAVAQTKDPVVVDMNIPEVGGVSVAPAH